MMRSTRALQEFVKGILRDRAREERGVALAIAMVLLVILSLVGSAAIMTSTTEVSIAGNEKQYQMAFYAADGGAALAPRVILDTFRFYDEPYYGSGVLVAEGLLDELMGFSTPYNDPDTDSTQTNPDILIPSFASALSVGIDVDRDPTAPLPGGGAEFGSGYEGVGSGLASGGSAILFRIESRSEGARNASSLLEFRYLQVTGIGGS